MRYLVLFIFFFSYSAVAQLRHTVEIQQKFDNLSEAQIKSQLLHTATLRGIEKFAPELGFKFDVFSEKLDLKFKEYFESYEQRKFNDKFGVSYQKNLTDAEKASYLETLEKDREELFIRYSRTQEILKSHNFQTFNKLPKEKNLWEAKVDLEIDKSRLDNLFRRIILNETKPIARIYLISQINPMHFNWQDLGVEGESSFLRPLNESWLKWFHENMPSTVEEVLICDESCLNYTSKWSETHVDNLSAPEEFRHSLFLKVSFNLKRSNDKFEWDGGVLLLNVETKRILGSFTVGPESRAFKQLDQKSLNSQLASSLYRTPIPAFMNFKQSLEEKEVFDRRTNRVSKLVIKGQKHLGDVLALKEHLKSAGRSLGLEVYLQSFSKDEANLICYHGGEEKSFTDFLSGIKELKSSQRYTLVNEFTGVHHVLKLVAE